MEDLAIICNGQRHDSIFEWFTHIKDSRRLPVEDHSHSWSRAPGTIAVSVLDLLRFRTRRTVPLMEVSTEQRSSGAGCRQAVHTLCGVFLHDAAIGQHDTKHGARRTIGRVAEKGCTH